MKCLAFLLGLFLFSAPMFPAYAGLKFHGVVSAVDPRCPKGGVPQNDFGGTPDECPSATLHPSYQNVNFFGTGVGNARQSGQAVYFYNDSTIPWNVPCVDNGCGYDTTQLTFDPINESFAAQNATISSGVLNVSSADLGVTFPQQNIPSTFYLNGVNNGMAGGLPHVGQTLSGTNVPANTVITAQIDATHWQTSQPSANVASTVISGKIHPQIDCRYWSSYTGNSSVPFIQCATTGDSTTPSVFNGYDGTIEGIWFRIFVGSGAGNTGEAGPITFSNNSFKVNSGACNVPDILTLTNTHFDLHVVHNQFDGNWPVCTQTSAMNTGTTGTAIKSQVTDVEWNAVINQPVDPFAGNGAFTYLTVANNMFSGICNERTTCGNSFPGLLHGAVYANSLADHMYQYTYRHNTILITTQPDGGSVTTSMSVLALAIGTWQKAVIDDVKFQGNISIVNCHGGANPCTGANFISSRALWSNVDPVAYGHLTSTSNLVDPTGSNGGYYLGGNSRRSNTATGKCYAAQNFCILTVTVAQDGWNPNAFLHVNATPFTWNGTIAPSGLNDGLGLMTLDSPNAGLAASNSVAGAQVPPGMYITQVINTTHFKVANFYGTDDAHLTARHEPMWTAFSVIDPNVIIDPATGLHPTGTGANTGTYAITCYNCSDIAQFTTWNRFNPAIINQPPTINTGTDRLINNGSSICLGGASWNSGFC